MKLVLALIASLGVASASAQAPAAPVAAPAKKEEMKQSLLIKVQQHLHPLRQTIRKPKLLRSNPSRLSLLINGDDFGFFIDDEGILSGYRLPKNSKLDELTENDDLSDYVRLRLFIARELAMKKYKEKWG